MVGSGLNVRTLRFALVVPSAKAMSGPAKRRKKSGIPDRQPEMANKLATGRGCQLPHNCRDIVANFPRQQPEDPNPACQPASGFPVHVDGPDVASAGFVPLARIPASMPARVSPDPDVAKPIEPISQRQASLSGETT